MTRRTLDLRSFDALRKDVLALAAGPYTRAGKWSLGQNCEHLSITIGQSMDGFPVKMPWPLRVMSPVVKWWMFRTRKMPTGIKGPKEMMPPAEADLDDRLTAERFIAMLDRYEAHTAPLQPSPVFGTISRSDWDVMHLIHASHHLSFIVPDKVVV